jgi:hypothetical protein
LRLRDHAARFDDRRPVRADRDGEIDLAFIRPTTVRHRARGQPRRRDLSRTAGSRLRRWF